MSATRRFLPLLSAGLCALPACVITRDSQPVTPVTPPGWKPPHAPAAAGPVVQTDFASLIRGPGERVATHEPDEGVQHRTLNAGSTEPAAVTLGPPGSEP